MLKIEYHLKKADQSNMLLIKEFKLKTILADNNVDDLEKEKIINYINKEVPKMLENYQLIEINNAIKGIFLYLKKDDGVFLDEIYLEEDCRGLGIGTDLLSKLIKEFNIVYLWVYKSNIKAINLYQSLNFKIIDETETRYFMKHE